MSAKLASPDLLAQEGLLGEADAVFAGDRAAEAERPVEDLVERPVHAVHFVVVAFVGQERRVQVAVAHVAEGADVEVVRSPRVSATKRIIFASSLRGTVTSSRIVVGAPRASAEKALRRAVASWRPRRRLRRTRTSRAPFLRAISSICAASSATAAGMAVGLHEQQGFAIERQADLREVLDAVDRRAVEKLQRAGNDLRGDDVGDRLRRRSMCA